MNKLTIFRTDDHDHSVAVYGNVAISVGEHKKVFANDYSYENVIRFAKFLDIPCEIVTLPRDTFEQMFA